MITDMSDTFLMKNKTPIQEENKMTKIRNNNMNEINLNSLSEVSGGFELMKAPDTRINWLEGHNIRCPLCKNVESGTISVALASNCSDAQCTCEYCGGSFKYRNIDEHIWLVL